MTKRVTVEIIKQLRKFILLTSIFLCTMLMVSHADAKSSSSSVQQDPVRLLQYIADHMIDGLKQSRATLSSDPRKVYQLAYRYVVPYADIVEMSRRVIPRDVWNRASPEERAQFERAFTQLLIRTYASALTAYDDQRIRIFPVRGNVNAMRSVEVGSEIVSSNAQPVRVTYRLLRAGGSWRLYDMSVEGVSLIESFRSQFADILSQGNLSTLLRDLQAHNVRRRSH